MLCKKMCNLSFLIFAKEVLAPVVLVLALMFVCGYLPQTFMEMSFGRLLISIFTTSVVFFIVIWLFVFKRQEKNNMLSIVKAKINVG